jgi:hypothetical protein
MNELLQFKATDDQSESLHLMNAIVVQEDRYGGCYSNHSFTAWVNVVPDDASAGDPTCEAFWKNNKILFGGGGTPDDAVADLLTKLYVDNVQTEYLGNPVNQGAAYFNSIWNTSEYDAKPRHDEEFIGTIKDRRFKDLYPKSVSKF